MKITGQKHDPGTGHMEPPELEAAATQQSLDDLIAAIDIDFGVFPEQALRELQRRPEEATPRLIELLRKAVATIRAGQDISSNGHFFAYFLLAEFRAKEALPAICEMLSLSENLIFELLGDVIFDDLGRSLAALTTDSVEVIDQLVFSSDVDPNVRGIVACTYLYFVRDGVLTREEALHRLQKLLQQAAADPEFIDRLMLALFQYSPVELRDEIQAIYQGFLNLEQMICWISWEEFEENFENGQQEFQTSLQNLPETGFSDCVAYLKPWHCFQPKPDFSPSADKALREVIAAYKEDPGKSPSDAAVPAPSQPRNTSNSEVRVGRNDPCPCGSGKKFKKCCRNKSND